MTTTDRPIFLVGCPRSGTTLLSVILHAHPRIAMPPETRFLLPAYHGRAEFGDLAIEANRRALAERITGRGSNFRDLGLNRRKVIADIVAAAPTFGTAAGTIWREFARSRGKARWGEKRPSYWRDMGLILRLFPDAQVIHLVRDGRSCVASLKEVGWWHTGAVGAMASWTLADSRLRRLGATMPADSYHRLRYEDLLADPRPQLEALCDFLGEEFDDVMLNYSSAAHDIVPDRKSWHDRTKGELDRRRIDAWRKVLEPGEIGLFERVAGAAMRRNGYDLSGAGTRPKTRAVLGYHTDRAHRIAVMRKEQLVDARLRRTHPQPLADQG
jgi:hypothetical protein